MTVLGLDVGGTKIAGGLVRFPEAHVLASRIVPTMPARGGAAVLADVERLVAECVAEAAKLETSVDAIGLGVCELVDPAGHILSSHCIDWIGVALRERFSQIAPTVVEADVRASARAEAMFGAGRDARVFLYVSIGTGISSCLVIGGEPFTGTRGATGTMASGPLPGIVEAPTTALSLERIASGPALVTRFKQLQGRAETSEEVIAQQAAGDALAERVVRSAAQTVGASIGWLVSVLDPELVIIGGGLGLSEGFYRETLIASARRHIWWEGHRDLPIVSAQTGPDAGWIGAAAAAWKAIS